MRMVASHKWQQSGKAASPFAWIGGKRRIAPELIKFFPPTVRTYWEPFCGGASVFFAVRKMRLAREYRISDLDEHVIRALTVVRDYPFRLGRIVANHMRHNSPRWFNHHRDRYADIEDPREKVGVMLYLIRAGFHSKWEINKSGRPTCTFNTGDLTAGTARQKFNTTLFVKASVLLRGAEIACRPFEAITPQEGDLVFCDPPYTGSPYKYTSGWNDQSLREFRQEADRWVEAGARVVVTHVDYPLFRDLFSDGFRLENYYAVRFHNPNAGKMKIDTDLVAISK